MKKANYFVPSVEKTEIAWRLRNGTAGTEQPGGAQSGRDVAAHTTLTGRRGNPMTTNEWLKTMTTEEPAEPRGWFRWLHNHYLGRYGSMHPGMINGDTFSTWEKTSPNPDTPEEKVDIDLLAALLERHAWACGMKKYTKAAAGLWDRLSSLSRGAFMAGLSEQAFDEEPDLIDRTMSRLDSAELSPESLCQLACNAIKNKRTDLLEALLAQYQQPTGIVRRFSASDSGDAWESEEVERLSPRVIDMILEASLICNNIDAARLALTHGANPDIPFWQLERSSNHKYSALGYVIDSEHAQNMQSHNEMAELLLDQGASPSGIAYAGYNHELFLALGNGWYDLADRLLAHGASFQKPVSTDEIAPAVRTAGSESVVLGPGGPNFFGFFGDKLKWAVENIGSIIPLVPVSEKMSFFSSHAQGGSRSTFMDRIVGNLDRLRWYESLGLDTRLSAEELSTAVSCGAFDSLVYLLSKHGETARDRAMFRIRLFRPDIGTAWRHMVMIPQADGVNIASDFNPQGQQSFDLPDGSRLFVDLSAVAFPGHTLGPCAEGFFWLRKDIVTLRRRKDRVVVYRLEKKWVMEPLPLRKPGTCRGQQYLDECLPLIREIDGKYIHLGVTLGRLWWVLPEGEMRNAVPQWNKTPGYDGIQDQAEELIRAQDAWNARPPEPCLTDWELQGYPPEYWCYLVRLDKGFISMTEESCHGNLTLLKDYNSWARSAKRREREFTPDRRLLEWDFWHEIPPDYKPYYYWDTMFGDRGSVTMGSYDNKYEREMASKVRCWHDRKWSEWWRARRK